MQYEVLAVVACAIACVLLVKNILSHLERKKSIRKKSINIFDVYKEQFSEIDKKEFVAIWEGLAKAINVDPGKMYPDDRLIEMSRLYPFPELLYENLEEFIKQTGIEKIEYKINDKSTIRDIIILIDKSRNKI